MKGTWTVEMRGWARGSLMFGEVIPLGKRCGGGGASW